VELRRVLVRDAKKASEASGLSRERVTNDAESFFATPDMPIVVEVAGGRGMVSQYVRRALAAGKHVITANKSLLAAEGHELFALARRHGVSIAFEASVAGGIPVITAMQFGLMANRIDALYGILNGTCNYILTEMTRQGKPYATALAEAQQKGYAEADPTLDVSGKDAAQKLAVLASLAFGVGVTEADVWNEGIDSLDLADIRFAAELGYDIKLLAIAERVNGSAFRAADPGLGTGNAVAAAETAAPSPERGTGGSRLSLRVHPSFIHAGAPLAQVHGSFNALSVYGHAVGHTMSYGRGAGQMPTASAVVSDILNVASGWYPLACERMHLLCDQHAPVETVAADDLVSRFYIRMTALDVPGVMASVSRILGESGISLSAILQHEANVGQFVPLVVVTHQARQGALFEAIGKIERLDVIDGQPVCIRIVDMPAE
jgi:homoserine dehydrogenase